MKPVHHILDNEIEVLEFLKTRYPMFHLSNVFFRDVQYGVQTFLERRGIKAGYRDAEKISREFVSRLEKKQILRPIDAQSWVLNYEPFRKPPATPAAPVKPAAAKPAGPAPAAPRPAGGLPPLKSATPAAARPAGGLPPLKSSAPAGAPKPAPVQQATPAAAPVQPAQPNVEEAPKGKAEVKPAPPSPAPAGEQPKPAAPAGKKTLPPIKSSKPVGG